MTKKKYNSVREDVYRLLAACYYSPTAALLEENCCASIAALLERAVPQAAQYAAAAAVAGSSSSPEALAVEHARLFIGPFQLVAPPYGSVYLDDSRNVMGNSTARVAAFYHACGLHLSDEFHDLPDHFTVELEFMSYLAFKRREAGSSDKQDEVARVENLEREFLEKFLLPWLEPFTSAIITDGEAPFYQAVARCTAAFISSDYNSLCKGENGCQQN